MSRGQWSGCITKTTIQNGLSNASGHNEWHFLLRRVPILIDLAIFLQNPITTSDITLILSHPHMRHINLVIAILHFCFLRLRPKRFLFADMLLHGNQLSNVSTTICQAVLEDKPLSGKFFLHMPTNQQNTSWLPCWGLSVFRHGFYAVLSEPPTQYVISNGQPRKRNFFKNPECC